MAVRRPVVGRPWAAGVALLVIGALVAVGGLVALPGAARASTAPAAGEYIPVTPARVVDTRTGLGGGSGQLVHGVARSFTLTGVGGVPTSGVSAVSLTVTVVAPTANAYLTVWATGDTMPTASQMSLDTGVTWANAVISKVGTGGQVSFYTNVGSTDLLVDVQGYYTNNQTTATGGTFVPLTPTRVYDTRTGLGGSSTKLAGGETRPVPVLGQAGVPSSGVSAVVVNVSGINGTGTCYFTVWGAGSRPAVSNVNIPVGQAAGAMVQSGVDALGRINVFNNYGSIDLFVDVEGYYLSPTADSKNFFVPVTPTRVYSTVGGLNAKIAKMTPGSTASVPIRGVKNGTSTVVPAQASVSAVVASVTAVTPQASGYLVVHPEGVPRPTSSIVNYTAANTGNVTGTVIAKIGTTGRISVYVSYGNPDLIVDVQGYFQSGPPAAPPAPSVTSSAFPSNGWAASGATGSLTASVAGVSGPAVRQYQWALDDPTLSAPTVVNVATDNAAGTISLTGGAAPADGWHTLSVRAVNTANNLSPVTSYSFGVGVAATAPTTGTTVSRYVTLQGRAPASFASVTWNWRRAPADPWTVVPAGQVTNNGTTINGWPVTGTSDSSGLKAPTLVWDAGTTLGADGSTQVQACYTPTGGGTVQCITDAAAPTVTVDKLGVGNTDATTDLAGGSLDLLTGNLGLSVTDASVDAPGSDLTISRTFNTLDPSRSTDPATGQASAFGTGWSTALSVDSAASSWTGLSDKGSTLVLADGDGASITFTQGADGKYRPTGDDADSGLTLTAGTPGTFGPASWTVADLDGNSTTLVPTGTFTQTASVTSPHAYQVGSITQPGSQQTTTYSYNAAGFPTQMLAPTPAAGCGTWVAGCRALELGYNASNDLTDITFHTTDATGAAASVEIACYAYTGGRLTSAWDPRDAATGGAGVDCTSPVRPTSYGYDGTGKLTTITPPGLAAWTLGYDGTGRLTSVSRTHDSAHGGGTETTAVVYDLPTTKDATHDEYRPNLTDTDVATWGQGVAPVTATAVFAPGHTSSSTDLRGASVSYLDAEGRTVNTAEYSATTGAGAAGWDITTTDYDDHGSIIRRLSAGNRAEALNPTGLADPRLNLSADTAAAANALSTTNIYAYDSNGVGDLVDTFGPLHLVTLPGQTLPVPARAHTHDSYDTGAETAHPAGGLLHLVTSSTVGASLSPLPVATSETDQRTTTTDYALSSTDATGWTFRKPMKVTVDPGTGKLNLATVTRYDATTGAVIETRQPRSSGADAATTSTVYYTAGTNTADSLCGNQPAWDTLVCTVGPKAQPGVSGLPGLPTKRITAYDYLNRPTTVQETVTDAAGATQTRTTTTSYANGGYGTDTASTTITGGLAGDTAVPASSPTYDPLTGLVTKITAGSVSASSGFDDFGRITSYTDNDQATGGQANTTSTSYDTAGRIASTTDAHGTTSYSYNEGGEYRDKATTVTDSSLGAITGTYDADGALTSQAVANGPTTTLATDEVGAVVSRRVEANGRAWLTETQTANIHGQILGNDYAGSANYAGSYDYTYDPAGRLTQTLDTVLSSSAVGACTTRTYAFDADSNRTSANGYNPASGGACQSTTATSTMTSTYDIADRLQAAGSHGGLQYDAFGRITTLPGGDTGNKGATATMTYHVNDLVRSITQNGLTQTFTLDAAGRLGNWTTTGTGGGADKTNHYDDSSSDSPDWIAENNTASSWTRNVTGLDGSLVATVDQAATKTWQITNIHGDVVATASASATEPASYYKTDEYGQANGSAPSRYGALGGKQRSTEAPAGLTLMGVRLYTPTLGRFLQTDPVPGGSANDYDYCNQDPINCFDLDGRFPHFHIKKLLHKVATVANVGSNLLAWCPMAQCQGASLALGAVAAGAYALSGDGDAARSSLRGLALNFVTGGRGKYSSFLRGGSSRWTRLSRWESKSKQGLFGRAWDANETRHYGAKRGIGRGAMLTGWHYYNLHNAGWD